MKSNKLDSTTFGAGSGSTAPEEREERQSAATIVYVNQHVYELLPGDSVEAGVMWRLPFLALTLTLRISLVEDRVLRLDSRRVPRRQAAPWKVRRAAVADSG